MTLYLVPTPVTEDVSCPWYGPAERRLIGSIRLFFAENEKTARRFLREFERDCSLQSLRIERFDKDSDYQRATSLIQLMGEYGSAGVLSEAGCPCIADPGAQLVQAAHEAGVRIVPLVGPSSIILALMASGLNGQQFVFHGYAPVREDALRDWVRQRERESTYRDYTHLWIEAPYRSAKMARILIDAAHPTTRILLARSVGSSEESIATRTAKAWRTSQEPLLDGPTVFGMLARA